MGSNQNDNISDQLLAILCHDLSSPLTVLAFNLEILSKTEFSDDSSLSQIRFNRCLSSVKKIRSILEVVKDTHLLKLGKLKLIAEPVSLRRCWSQAATDFDSNLQLKKISIKETEWPQNDLIMGHEQILVSHVFSNLLSNAIKFSQPGGTIWVGAQSLSENEISFYLSDEGNGIPESKIDSIFDLNKPTTSIGTALERGSGLGLPIVRFFLIQLNAEIYVRSRISLNNDFLHGTLFEIRFRKASFNL